LISFVSCVDCCGQPGATACPGRKSLHSLLPQILDKHPDVVLLQTGENDVSNGLCGAKAAGEIVDVVKYPLDGAVSRVMVGQVDSTEHCNYGACMHKFCFSMISFFRDYVTFL